MNKIQLKICISIKISENANKIIKNLTNFEHELLSVFVVVVENRSTIRVVQILVYNCNCN